MRAMRLAVAKKAGVKSWQEIFNAATAKGATSEMLGDALAAVALPGHATRGHKRRATSVLKIMIRRGNESRIPEMVELLTGYGDKTLAEDYLNCGQPDLGGAAKEWARQHGNILSELAMVRTAPLGEPIGERYNI